MKGLRIFFSVIGLFILIGVLAIAGLIVFMDPNKLKPIFAEEIMRQTGYQVTIDGKLTWTFYPRIGIKINHLALQMPNQSKPFLDLNEMSLAAELSQLLRGREKLQGDIRIASVRLLNVHASDVKANLQWQNQVFTIQAIQSAFYGGRLEGEVHGRNLSQLPQWDFALQARQVQLQALLQDVNGQGSRFIISGNGQVSLRAVTSGKTREQLITRLIGVSEFNVYQGTVSGININYLLQAADAVLNKQPVPAPDDSNQTTFSTLSGSASIKNGVADTHNLLLASAAFAVDGQGQINLLNQSLDLALQIKPQQTLKTQWEIPVTVTGNLNRPEIRLDTLGLQKVLAKREIEKIKNKASDLIEKNVGGDAGKFLQHLLR